MSRAKSLRDLMRIRAHNREFLKSIDGNLGTALGYKKRTGQPLSKEPAIIVFVPQKINQKWIPGSQVIPNKLKGPGNLWCRLDVVEGGKADAKDLKTVEPGTDELCERLRGWDKKICPGSQISCLRDEANRSYDLGTLAAFAKRRSDGKLGFLTNKHVAMAEGKKLYHPIPCGIHLGTTTQTIEYLKDEEYYGPDIDEPNTYVRVDGAFVELSDNVNLRDLKPQMMGVGQLGTVRQITFDDMSIIGQKVIHVGRTTGLRRGIIAAFAYEYVNDKEDTIYTDLLIAGYDNQPFSTYGDSGSLIVLENEELNPIGLLWGGWQEKLRTGYSIENWTYGVFLSPLLNLLEIDLVLEGNHL
jgi:hypothetical protein